MLFAFFSSFSCFGVMPFSFVFPTAIVVRVFFFSLRLVRKKTENQKTREHGDGKLQPNDKNISTPVFGALQTRRKKRYRAAILIALFFFFLLFFSFFFLSAGRNLVTDLLRNETVISAAEKKPQIVYAAQSPHCQPFSPGEWKEIQCTSHRL